MWKFRRFSLLILSALLICALLMVSFPILTALTDLGGGNAIVYAYDPCADCAEVYDAWKKAEADWENCPDKSLWACYYPYGIAKAQYENCRAWDCYTVELNCSFDYKHMGHKIIKFDASASKGNIKRYCWLFDESKSTVIDGKPIYDGYGTTIQHEYFEPGTYWVLLHVDSVEGTKSSECRLQISVGQDKLKIELITPPDEINFGVETRWELQFKGTCAEYEHHEIRFGVYDQNETHLGSYGLYDIPLEDLILPEDWSVWSPSCTFDKLFTADILIPSGTTALTFKAYLHVPGIDGPTAFAEELYRFENLEIVKFSCDAPHPGKLGEYYEVDVEIVDKKDNSPWTYMFRTSAGEFLYSGDWLSYSRPDKVYLTLDEKHKDIKWQSPTRESNLELEYAKNMILVTKGLARNLTATGSSTIPVIGRVIKTANDVYNLVDSIETMGGYAGKSWQAMTRGELLRAVMHASNATVEGVQAAAGGILLIPKAFAPAGLKEAANVLTDTANAGIDYVQVTCETLTEALAEKAKTSKVICVSLLVKVTNQEPNWCGAYIIVELHY